MKYKLTEKALGKLFPHLANTSTFVLESNKVLNEAQLNPNNAVPIQGNIENGKFQVGQVKYNYNFILLPKGQHFPGNKEKHIIEDRTYDVNFHVEGENSSENKKGQENLTKIYTTMYKIILDFCEKIQPNFLLISAFDRTNYFSSYSTLTQTHKIPGYQRKTIIHWEYPNKGPMTSIILKKI